MVSNLFKKKGKIKTTDGGRYYFRSIYADGLKKDENKGFCFDSFNITVEIISVPLTELSLRRDNMDNSNNLSQNQRSQWFQRQDGASEMRNGRQGHCAQNGNDYTGCDAQAAQPRSHTPSRAGIFMQQVYLWMTAALGVSAIAAVFTASNETFLRFFFSGGITTIIFAVAIVGLVLYISARIHTLSSGAATFFFFLYAALNGVFLGPVLLVYTGSSVAQAFFVTASTFAGISVYGTMTKRDLSGMGNFLMMGLWGIILASIVNLFGDSSSIDFAISVIGVLIFTGLTAHDTQKILMRGNTVPPYDGTAIRRVAILGALELYLDFVNLFLRIFRLFGIREWWKHASTTEHDPQEKLPPVQNED